MIMAKVRMRVRPPLRKCTPSGRRLDCACLEDDARNEFRCSLAEKLRELELILGGQNATDEQWTSIRSALHEAPAHTISYKSRNHQDWFDNNSDTSRNSLIAMQKAHRVTLKNPSSCTARQQW